MSTVNISAVLDAIKSCLPQDENYIGLHEPFFGGNEWSYVKECLDTGWVSSVGKFVDKFENALTEFTGAKRAVAVVNGTAALHIALSLVGVEQNDEVLVPDLTFVAIANAVMYCGAVPHFIDSEKNTLGIDPGKLEMYLREISQIRLDGCYNKKTGRRIKAVVPMHTFGHPVDLDTLEEISSRYKLEMIEDAAEALGSYYKGKHVGNWGKLSTLSFNGNKTITTGGGGAIITNDEALGRLVKHITTTAKAPHKWSYFHDMVGYNYRLPNINAALGCAQLEQLPQFVEKKRTLSKKYQKAFTDISGISFFLEPDFAKSNYWLNAISLENSRQRDDLLEITNSKGIMTRPTWTLMHRLPMFQSCPRMDLSVAKDIEAKVINIPSSPFLIP